MEFNNNQWLTVECSGVVCAECFISEKVFSSCFLLILSLFLGRCWASVQISLGCLLLFVAAAAAAAAVVFLLSDWLVLFIYWFEFNFIRADCGRFIDLVLFYLVKTFTLHHRHPTPSSSSSTILLSPIPLSANIPPQIYSKQASKRATVKWIKTNFMALKFNKDHIPHWLLKITTAAAQSRERASEWARREKSRGKAKSERVKNNHSHDDRKKQGGRRRKKKKICCFVKVFNRFLFLLSRVSHCVPALSHSLALLFYS
jgi:hypothetical protein